MPTKNSKVPLGQDGRTRITVSLDRFSADLLQRLLDTDNPVVNKTSISRILRNAIFQLAKARGLTH